ncbi:YdeI/OmpD-associated family protein [Wandonia haliotis]|uniref:YdeI/OmpD-associated family protein n=1 Tax=Wandonia haliotis TaxID=574963 RepID=A0ABN1MLM4_9FLAO
MAEKEIEIYYPTSCTDWRKWLEKNHQSEPCVWVVFYSKRSGKKTISWSEAVDVALCFGWIDSKKVKIDETCSHQYFSKRKPKSTWSKINKEKVQVLIKNGEMTPAGFKSIETAKQNGSWTLLDEVEELIIPDDLEDAFAGRKGAKDYFLSLSKSSKKSLLHWIVLAKRPETRQKRIDEISELAEKGMKPKQFR